MVRISVLIKGAMQWRSYGDAVIDEDDWGIYVTQYDRANSRKVKYVFPKSEIAELTIRSNGDETNPEKLMEYIWAAINDALGTDDETVTPEAEKIYNCILEKLQKEGFNV